jgi:GNAT superfamily N-acetyltransferase
MRANVTRMEVRTATLADAATLSRVHVETWEDTFAGQIPEALAREHIAMARARDWVEHGVLRARTGGDIEALIDDQHVVGFCEFGPTEDADDDPQRVGHIMRLYVHPLHQSRGGGKLLVESACARLASGGYGEATLWTLKGSSNRAHRFFVHLGWSNEGIRKGAQPPDVRYRRRLRTSAGERRDRDRYRSRTA